MTTEIFQPHQRPKRLTQDQLVGLAQTMIAVIANADSMEGSITYGWSDEPGQYDVHAFIRTGNSMGQGGAIVIQDTALLERGLAQSAAGEVKDLGDFAQYAAKPGEYEVTWTRTVEADDPVEAAAKALQLIQGQPITLVNAVEVAPDTKFEVDGREIDPEDPPLCTAQIFGGSRIDPPEYCDEVGTHWDEDDNPWCDKHSAQPDPFEGRDI